MPGTADKYFLDRTLGDLLEKYERVWKKGEHRAAHVLFFKDGGAILEWCNDNVFGALRTKLWVKDLHGIPLSWTLRKVAQYLMVNNGVTIVWRMEEDGLAASYYKAPVGDVIESLLEEQKEQRR